MEADESSENRSGGLASVPGSADAGEDALVALGRCVPGWFFYRGDDGNGRGNGSERTTDIWCLA